MNLFLPNSDISLRNLTKSRFPTIYNILPLEVEASLVKIMMREIDLIRLTQFTKHELTIQHDFSSI